ncbi:hypothetical protein CBOM_00618 [Ceraceosorus bombacis]|uniref:Uncharacterized protein n=1 Tax=Ceraceosorus bombacis TaxID=401625 RepID=A0A0P1B9K8_9BASI|nr:hypothetical protein CBOM_00618 [Ceraceosorus bombacis]
MQLNANSPQTRLSQAVRRLLPCDVPNERRSVYSPLGAIQHLHTGHWKRAYETAASAVTRAESLSARSGQERGETNEEPKRRGDRSSQKSRLITAILTERPGATSGQGIPLSASEGAVPRRVRSQRRRNAPAHASSSSAVPTSRDDASARSEHQEREPATTSLPVEQRGRQSMVMWSAFTDTHFRGMPPKAKEDMSKSIAAWAEASQAAANVHVLGIGPSVLPHHVSVHHQLYDEGMNKISNPKISEVPHVMTHF